MPNGALRPCNYPGCSNLVQSGRCNLHPMPVKSHALRHNPAHQKLYDSEWRARRKAHLEQFPYCADCLKMGKSVMATDVHHVVRHEGDPVKFANSPLISLCHTCHARRTAKEVGFA